MQVATVQAASEDVRTFIQEYFDAWKGFDRPATAQPAPPTPPNASDAVGVGPNGRTRQWAWRPLWLALLPKVIDLYRRIRPTNSAFCYLESLLCGEKFFKSEDHYTLGEEVGVPFRKVDFSMIPICRVGVASDDERDLGSRKSIGAELPLH